jgi:hypothetical protein
MVKLAKLDGEADINYDVKSFYVIFYFNYLIMLVISARKTRIFT